jgi:hypothetical protein
MLRAARIWGVTLPFAPPAAPVAPSLLWPAMPGFVLDVAAVSGASDVMGEDADQHQTGGEQSGGSSPQT